MLSAIKEFPMPTEPSITDIRSWFGLVHQLAPFLVSTPIMEPFRELLKPTTIKNKEVYWDTQLQTLFEKAKEEICKLSSNGLAYYDIKKNTVVITDWSKQGIGFVVMQQHCSCKNTSNIPTCCANGWKLALCQSQFLTPAESKYAPIEGEALAVAWALEKARLFLLGSPMFTVIVDHQPLLKILGDKSLSEFSNPRLLHFKEKILPYSFKIQYIKGIKNHANVFSRYPVDQPTSADIEDSKCINVITANITSSTIKDTLLITTDIIKDVSKSDIQYQKLVEKIQKGSFKETQSLEDPDVRSYFNVRDRLSIIDNIIMYGFQEKPLRIVIPKALQCKIIENLHSANQGTTSMLARARQCVYWPGIDDDDINKHLVIYVDKYPHHSKKNH